MQTGRRAWPRCGLARPAGVLSGEDLAAQPEAPVAVGSRHIRRSETDAGGRQQLLEWGRCVLYWVAANGVEFDGGAHRTECGTGQWLSVLDTSGARRRMAAGGAADGSPFWLTDVPV